jgi:membrane protease YdiL (CAAX protease family)
MQDLSRIFERFFRAFLCCYRGCRRIYTKSRSGEGVSYRLPAVMFVFMVLGDSLSLYLLPSNEESKPQDVVGLVSVFASVFNFGYIWLMSGCSLAVISVFRGCFYSDYEQNRS